MSRITYSRLFKLFQQSDLTFTSHVHGIMVIQCHDDKTKPTMTILKSPQKLVEFIRQLKVKQPTTFPKYKGAKNETDDK